MTWPLPVNLDSTYPDDAGDPTVALHQGHHDLLHAFANDRYLGPEIDAFELAQQFDVKAVGTTLTYTGMSVLVPPQNWSYCVEFDGEVSFATGTAAANAVLTVSLYLLDESSLTCGVRRATAVQGSTAATIASYESVSLRRRFEPNTATKFYAIYAVSSTVPANWSAALLRGGSGENAEAPALLVARSAA